MAKPIYAAAFGAGLWMIDLCIQLYSSANPDKLKPHPYVIGAVGVLGLLIIVYAGFQWLQDRRKKPALDEVPVNPSQESTKTQIATGDVSGKMFQAEVLHYHEAQQIPQQVPSLPALDPEPKLHEIPLLVIRPRPTLCLANSSQKLTFSETGNPGMIVRIENSSGGDCWSEWN